MTNPLRPSHRHPLHNNHQCFSLITSYPMAEANPICALRYPIRNGDCLHSLRLHDVDSLFNTALSCDTHDAFNFIMRENELERGWEEWRKERKIIQFLSFSAHAFHFFPMSYQLFPLLSPPSMLNITFPSLNCFSASIPLIPLIKPHIKKMMKC